MQSLIIILLKRVNNREELRHTELEMSSWSRTHTTIKCHEKQDILKSSDVSPPKRDLVNMVYATPTCTDTAVIMVFFNPAGSFRILQNLLYIKQQLECARIPLFIGELAYNDVPYVFASGSSNIFQFRTSSYMFSKENLLNAVIRNDTLKKFSKYVIIDCDIVFDTADWVDGISVALERYDVVQPFQYVNQLNLKFKANTIKSSIVYDPLSGHTGYVWAFRRDWFDRIGGLYEYALIGGGDKCLAHMAGIMIAWIPKPYERDIPVRGDVGKTSYLPYTIWHLPHGAFENRRYIERADTLQRTMTALHIDSLQHAVERGTNGIFEWKPVFKTHLNAIMLNYFKSREDDG